MPEQQNEVSGGGAFAAPREILRLMALVALAAFVADWASKHWALNMLDGTLPLGALVLGVERNPAFAFSAGAGTVAPWLVIAIRVTALLALALLSRSVAVQGPRYAVGIGLILGGGTGNAVDLLFREHGVIDFIGTGPFSLAWLADAAHVRLVFNTADLAVLLGIGLLAPLIRAWSLSVQERVARWESGLAR